MESIEMNVGFFGDSSARMTKCVQVDLHKHFAKFQIMNGKFPYTISSFRP